MKFPNRLGNKESIANVIAGKFPPHSIYVELFYGAGGIFLNKRPVAKHNILNDLSSEVYNLYEVLLNPDKRLKLEELIQFLPQHQSVLDYIVAEWYDSYDQVERAAAYAIFSTYIFRGAGSTLRLGTTNSKKNLLNSLKEVTDFLARTDFNIQFTCKNFDKVLPAIADVAEVRKNGFVYADPPYLQTGNNYSKNSLDSAWKMEDFIRLHEHLESQKVRYAISERNNPVIIEYAESVNLNIIPVANMQTILGTRQEILLTNYIYQETIF